MAETRAANPVPLGAAGPKQPVRVEDAYFDVEVCRNCAAPLLTPFCGACGQKKARRLSWRDLRRETWEHWRLFEISSLRTLKRLLTSPGYIAREYVMGRRKDHMHPLKLLALVILLLVLVLSRNAFFQHFGWSDRADADLDRMTTLVQAYSKWSFSTSIFAIFLSSWLVFRRRLGYNAVEHLVLAVYCQILILAAIVLSLLPTLFWTDRAFTVAYKTASGWALYAVKLLVVGVAFKQFFLVQLRHERLRLAAALLAYLAFSRLLLRAYAWLVLWLVRLQVS